ncbi:MAG: DUF1254 domain-containing protein, partial [Thermoguttaceae bacterium]|nr:DUF1254 domain-containing protein [Thermoguttaceae bacterium]
MLRQTTTRRQSRSSALAVSALIAVGSFAAPASIFADTPSQANAPTPSESVSSSVEPTPPASDVVVESVTIRQFVEPSFSVERPLRISVEEAKKFEALVDLYAYAYPLVLANEIKRETTSRFFLSTANETFYFPRLPDARYRATEFPNVDSIFATAWLDLAREPQIVVAPANTNVPFSLEIVDAWSNVVASFDEKTLGELPIFQIDGRSLRGVALIGPKSPKPTNLPPEIRVVESPSSLALVLTRVFVDNTSRSTAFGTRPAVQTLYDFATVAASTFTTELKEEKTKVAPEATPLPVEKPTNAVDVQPTSDVQETPLNQNLTPPQTGAFNQLKRLYVAQNAARYASSADEEKTQAVETAPQADAEKPTDATDKSANVSDSPLKDDSSPSSAENDAVSRQDESAPSVEASQTPDDKTSTSRQEIAKLDEGERDYERERDEERREVDAFWREIKEREHEASRSFDASYEGVKNWFYRRLENDKHFWSQVDEAFRRDARRDFRQIERRVETPPPARPWVVGPVERVARM